MWSKLFRWFFKNASKTALKLVKIGQNWSKLVPKSNQKPSYALWTRRAPIGSDMPWPGFLLGQTPASIWYWCADQIMVQKVLAARSLSHAQGATILCGWIKVLPLFLIVIPGMISRVLYPDEIGCVDPEICQKICQNPVSCSNIAYPKLVLGIMPEGNRNFWLKFTKPSSNVLLFFRWKFETNWKKR